MKTLTMDKHFRSNFTSSTCIKKSIFIFFKKNKHYLLQGDIYTMDISSGKTIYIYMCIWGDEGGGGGGEEEQEREEQLRTGKKICQ